jgi:hypothetical protein
MLTTPSGIPASVINSAILNADNGVYSAVFITIVHPAARLGANFQACIKIGKFQGIICAITPTGYLLVLALKGPSMFKVCPRILSTHPA